MTRLHMTDPAPPLGEALRSWRLRRRKRQADVAALLGVSQNAISQAERKGRCTTGLLARLVALYDPPAGELDAAMRETAEAAK